MRSQCHCGGKLRRTDIIKVGEFYQDSDPLMAHWSCEKCHAEYTQKKRQPKPKEKPVRISDGKEVN